MTVEQRVYSRDDEDSQRVEKPLVVEDEVLSENGAQVKNSLFAIIERYQDSNPVLAELILAEVKSYPDQLFNQLGLVTESPVLRLKRVKEVIGFMN